MDELRVVVTVGTDHHHFVRLLDWIERWTSDSGPVVCYVQHGSTPLPERLTGSEFLPHHELLHLMRSADVVVAQGGPGSIMDARTCGRRPVVVPRLARLQEAVDDHQVAFCHRMAALGRVALAMDEGEMRRHLDHARATPEAFRTELEHTDLSAVVERFGQLVDEVVDRPRRRWWRRSAQPSQP